MTMKSGTRPVDVVLTSRFIKSGNLIRNRELVLLINGVHYDEYFSNNMRVECLNKTITEYDRILETVALKFREHPFGTYLWLYTPDFIRSEDILDFYRRLYLKSIIQCLADQNVIFKIAIEVPVSVQEKRFLRKLAQRIQINQIQLLKNRILNFLLRLKSLFKLCWINIQYFISKPNESFDGTLIDTSTRFTKSRYDNLKVVESLFSQKVKYYSGEQMRIRGTDKSKTIEFKRELSIGILFASLLKSIKIRNFIHRNKANIPPDLFYNHSGFFKFLLYWNLVISQKCIDKFLSRSAISNIIQVSTLTKPIYRSLIASAKIHGVPFIQVASRTLMKTRCSERLLRCDVEELSGTGIPDYFILKDQYSKKVFNSFPELHERIFVGGRYRLPPVIKKENNSGFALLILLNHRKDLSEKILNIVRKTEIFKNVEIIYFRCHPSTPFSENEISNRFPEKIITDISGKGYDAMLNHNVIAISGATTASLEAVQYGAVLLWIPFIWDDSILFDDLMNELGIKCDSPQMITEAFEKLYSDKLYFQQQIEKDKIFCSENFMPEKLISEQIAAILQIAKK